MSLKRGWRVENEASIRTNYIGVETESPPNLIKQKHFMIFIVLKVMYSRESIYDETEK